MLLSGRRTARMDALVPSTFVNGILKMVWPSNKKVPRVRFINHDKKKATTIFE